VVTGVSFLGAGTIFVSRGDQSRVKGLTTAASLWVTAAVGIAVGIERYVLAVGSTGLILLILWLVQPWSDEADDVPADDQQRTAKPLREQRR
jgi:putative Mg2+ transporter-C (MgtC) family protein